MSKKTEMYKHCQLYFPHAQPLSVKRSHRFFDPVPQIIFQFVQVDLQLWRHAFSLSISPLTFWCFFFLQQRTQFA